MITESNIYEVAEHAVSDGYNNEPYFCSWISKVLKKRSVILKEVKTRCQKSQKYKFGVQILIYWAEAKNLYEIHCDTIQLIKRTGIP